MNIILKIIKYIFTPIVSIITLFLVNYIYFMLNPFILKLIMMFRRDGFFWSLLGKWGILFIWTVLSFFTLSVYLIVPMAVSNIIKKLSPSKIYTRCSNIIATIIVILYFANNLFNNMEFDFFGVIYSIIMMIIIIIICLMTVVFAVDDN